MENFEIRRVTFEVSTLAEYSRLFAACFPGNSKLTVDYLRWLYALNPDGGAIGYDAFADGQLAAHYVVVPVYFSSPDGDVLKGSWSLNTATHPDFQGKGLFVKLAEKTYATARDEGCEFVVGVANQNSTSGFVRRLGFANLGQLSTEVGYFNLDPVERMRGWRRRWDRPAIEWRLRNPSAKYEIHRRGESTVVFRPLRHGVVNVDLGDFPNSYFDRTERKIVNSVLPSIRVSFGYQSKGLFVRVPKKFLRSPWNVIFRQLAPKQLVDPAEIRIVGLDSDTF